MNIKPMTYRTVFTGLTIGLAGLLAGCTMEGDWSLAKVEPTAARRDFLFENLTLQKDSTFYAEVDEGTVRSVSGTWELRDGVLTLKEHDGERHMYDAKLIESGTKLQLVRLWDGRHMTAVFEKSAS